MRQKLLMMKMYREHQNWSYPRTLNGRWKFFVSLLFVVTFASVNYTLAEASSHGGLVPFVTCREEQHSKTMKGTNKTNKETTSNIVTDMRSYWTKRSDRITLFDFQKKNPSNFEGRPQAFISFTSIFDWLANLFCFVLRASISNLVAGQFIFCLLRASIGSASRMFAAPYRCNLNDLAQKLRSMASPTYKKRLLSKK